MLLWFSPVGNFPHFVNSGMSCDKCHHRYQYTSTVRFERNGFGLGVVCIVCGEGGVEECEVVVFVWSLHFLVIILFYLRLCIADLLILRFLIYTTTANSKDSKPQQPYNEWH